MIFIVAPGVAKSPSQAQPKPNGGEQQPHTDQRGTEQSPVFVKITPSEVLQDKPESATAKEDDKASADWWMVKLTGVLAFIGFFQLIVFGWQAHRLKQTIDTMERLGKKQSEDTQAMAAIADRQLSIMGSQTDIQEKQHAIDRLQFLAEHRPRLRVRHVNIRQGPIDPAAQSRWMHEQKINGGLCVVNIGGSKARIIESKYRIFFSKSGLPSEAPYDTGARRLFEDGDELSVGQSCAIPIDDIITMTPAPPGGSVIYQQFEREGWKLYVMGQIRYRDEGGADRFMGFCRLHDGQRFKPVDDPDYEYED